MCCNVCAISQKKKRKLYCLLYYLVFMHPWHFLINYVFVYLFIITTDYSSMMNQIMTKHSINWMSVTSKRLKRALMETHKGKNVRISLFGVDLALPDFTMNAAGRGGKVVTRIIEILTLLIFVSLLFFFFMWMACSFAVGLTTENTGKCEIIYWICFYLILESSVVVLRLSPEIFDSTNSITMIAMEHINFQGVLTDCYLLM